MMYFLNINLSLLALIVMQSCQGPAPVVDMEQHPPIREDLLFQNVFAPLDGIWKGTFYIYYDSTGQQSRFDQPDTISETWLRSKPLVLKDSVQVHQQYTSITPYYQQVSITDTYIQPRDTQVVVSEGINKVEQGKLWCIVKKPDELIVHSGEHPALGVLVWSRNVTKPFRKEYFRETVAEDEYSIVGYGFYGDDNPKLAPRTYFLGTYHRVSDYFR